LEAESGGLYARRIIKSVKKRRKRGPKKGGPGPPGRGVLRFLAQASADLGVDVIQPPRSAGIRPPTASPPSPPYQSP